MNFRRNYIIIILLALSFAIGSGCSENKAPLKPQSGYVDVTGGKIWYGVIGEGDKTPILTMHGGPGGTSRYYYQLSPLSDERSIIMFDQLGTGKSDHHMDTSLLKPELFVEQVEALVNHLDLKEFYVMGSSWGSALAIKYYEKYPNRIKGIIFGSPYFSTEIWRNDAEILISQLPDSIQEYIAKGEATGDFGSHTYQMANSVFAENFGRRSDNAIRPHPADTIESRRSSFIYNYMWGPTEFTATGTLKTFDATYILPTINIPVLFLTGEYDEARPETVKKFHEKVKGSSFAIISNSGHGTLIDNPDEVIWEIRDWIEKSERE